MKPSEPSVIKEVKLPLKGEGNGLNEFPDPLKTHEACEKSPGNAEQKIEALNRPKTTDEKLLQSKRLLQKPEGFFNFPSPKITVNEECDLLAGRDGLVGQKKHRFPVHKSPYGNERQFLHSMRECDLLPIKSDGGMMFPENLSQAKGKLGRDVGEDDRSSFRKKNAISGKADEKMSLLNPERS